MAVSVLDRIADGRTDLVFEHVGSGHPATTEANGAKLIDRCFYYGDVSAIKFLLAHGESMESLNGDGNFGLGTACFFGHWQLCQFLIEAGARVNVADLRGMPHV